jgi:hypothetical protein
MMNDPMVRPWEDALRAAVRVQNADSGFARRLRGELMRKAAAREPVRRRPALRPVWVALAAAFAVLLAALLLIGPDKVVAALQTLLGYLPGIGFVRMDRPFRVLEGPIKEEKSGASLYILQALADDDRTVVVYEVDCPGPESQWVKTGAFCVDSPALVLPGGARLEAAARFGGSALPYYRERAEFAALPSDATSVEFHLPFRASPGGQASPWIVEIPLTLSTRSATIYPVMEVAPSARPSADAAASDPLPEGIGFSLERIVALKEDYFLQGSVAWDPQRYTYAALDDLFLEIVDGDGALCPWEFADPDPSAGAADNRTPWAVRFNPRGRPGPFHIRAGSILVEMPADASFEMDFGSAPRIGQTWPLNIPLRAADYGLRVASARIEGGSGSFLVVFSFEGDEGLIGAVWQDADQTAQPLGGGEAYAPPGVFESGAAYARMPTGRHTIRILSIRAQLRGNWTIPVEVNF